ncbi:sulfotransferase family 2 domain-containing protein [Novosphingobium sp. BL-8A]
MIINPDKCFVFIHIPKCAGTSLRSALQPVASAAPNGQGAVPISRAVNANTKHESFLEFHAAFQQRTGLGLEALANYKFIAFSRHPFARFCSLHAYLLKTHANIYPDVPQGVDDFVVEFCRGEKAYLQKIRSLKTQFSFVEGVPPENLVLGKTEDIGRDFEMLAEMFQLTAKLEHLNASRSLYQEQSPLSPSSKRLLEEKYRQDFAYLGYQP